MQNEARIAIENVDESCVEDLRRYYNHALISRRAVVTDVGTETWKTDLESSLAAVTFAREHAEARDTEYANLQRKYVKLIEVLRADVNKLWFKYAVQNARRPTMIAMPSLPAINLGVDEERFYVQAVSDSWPSKDVSVLEGDVIKVSSRASRRFVDGMVAGDMGGLELRVTDHEKSFVENHSIGWITRYESVSRVVTIIEIDPWSKGEVLLDEQARRAAHDLVKVKEQRLDAFSLSTKLHEEASFADNLILSRLLAIDQVMFPIHARKERIDVREYIHVSGSFRDGLGPVDEEVFLKSLGSMTAKNKVRSALAIAAKGRLERLQKYGSSIRNITWGEEVKFRSRMVRCGVDGIYVKTRVPFDSLLVICITIVLSVVGCRALIKAEGVGSLAEATSLALALTLGVGVTFHNLRYKSWPIGETVRRTRMCVSDEEMAHCMSKHEMICTIAEAGAKGAGMDGILTCPFSDSQDGKFSMTRPLDLKAGSKVGLNLRLSTGLKPVWVDLKGVRDVEEKDIWHVVGSYVDRNYLEFTSVGPNQIG